MAPRRKTPPRTAGQRLVDRMNAALSTGVVWDEREVELLDLARRQADDIAALERLLAEQGSVVTGSTGQERLNPIYAEVRLARIALGRLLGQIRLPDESGIGYTPDAAKQRAANSRHRRRAGIVKAV